MIDLQISANTCGCGNPLIPLSSGLTNVNVFAVLSAFDQIYYVSAFTVIKWGVSYTSQIFAGNICEVDVHSCGL